MDESVRRAMAKWPNVPAVYGWLALDRRGNWLIKRETIGNAALNSFISRNYLYDSTGCWFFQNGPQRVFVSLDYTPLVYRVTSHLRSPLALSTQLGGRVNTLHSAWIDEQGAILLHTDCGIGLVHDQDIDPLLLAAMVDVNGNVIEESAFDALLAFIEQQRPIPLWLKFRGSPVKFERIRSADVPRQFVFNPAPQPAV